MANILPVGACAGTTPTCHLFVQQTRPNLNCLRLTRRLPHSNPIIIVGAGGCGRGVAQLVIDLNREAMKWKVLGFVTDDADEGRWLQSQGHHWLGTFSDGQYLTKVPNESLLLPSSWTQCPPRKTDSHSS